MIFDRVFRFRRALTILKRVFGEFSPERLVDRITRVNRPRLRPGSTFSVSDAQTIKFIVTR
jgi:hypothetical protein